MALPHGSPLRGRPEAEPSVGDRSRGAGRDRAEARLGGVAERYVPRAAGVTLGSHRVQDRHLKTGRHGGTVSRGHSSG